MKTNILLLFCLFCASLVFAQEPKKQQPVKFEPPKEIDGFKVRYATLSKGKYQEIFTNDTIQQIGSVYFNRITGEVIGEVERDSLYFPADVNSRWISPDPLAEKFPEQSPYNYANNNPIYYIDPDGRAAVGCCLDVYPMMFDMVASVASSVSTANKRADAMIRTLNMVKPGGATTFDKISAYSNTYLGTGAGNYTDANDAAVLTQGRNLDGSKATKGDYVFAGIGLMLPVVGGSAVKNMLEKVGEITVKNTTKQSGTILDFAVKDGAISFKGQKNPEGMYDFIITKDGELRIGSRHYTLSEGAETVKGAGQIYINKSGKIDMIDNFSGHYQPTKEELINQTRILQSAGLLDKSFDVVNKGN